MVRHEQCETSAVLAVVGGGILGLAVAAELARRHSTAKVIVLEKENDVARHQTGHNSGVVHSGLYYAPGSLKAQLCREGVGLIKAYCSQHALPYEEVGKLVVARDATEVERLRELERRGQENGVPDLEWLDATQVRQRQPGAVGLAALYSPTTAITDYTAITKSLSADVRAAGGEVRTGALVRRIYDRPDGIVVNAGGVDVYAQRLVICAGLQSDQVATLAGDGPAPEIIPFRGEYLRLQPGLADRVRHLIYPVPDPRYPFLGVHVTPRVDGQVDIGPNAVLALAREGYRRSDVSIAELNRLARSRAMRHLARQNWRMGINEARGSLSRRRFLAEARTYLPWLRMEHLVPAPAGVRAQAVDPDGSLVDDFRFGGRGRVLTLRNAPSPAATASLAIARLVVNELESRNAHIN